MALEPQLLCHLPSSQLSMRKLPYQQLWPRRWAQGSLFHQFPGTIYNVSAGGKAASISLFHLQVPIAEEASAARDPELPFYTHPQLVQSLCSKCGRLKTLIFCLCFHFFIGQRFHARRVKSIRLDIAAQA